MRFATGSLGFPLVPPKIGEPLVIGRTGTRGVRITTPVTRVIALAGGVLVHTMRSRYLIACSGDAYLVE